MSTRRRGSRLYHLLAKFGGGTLAIMLIANSAAADGPGAGLGRWDRYQAGGTYQGSQPRFTPDGRFVIYSSPATGHGDIYRFDRRTGIHLRLTADPLCEVEPLVTPDGSKIIFVREQGTAAHLWAAPIDGSDPRQLTTGDGYDSNAMMSTDASKVVFRRSRGGIAHLWVMDADGGNQHELTAGPFFDSCPLWSRDGSRIVFSRRDRILPYLDPIRGATTLRFPEVYAMGPDGSNQRRLTQNRGYDEPVAAIAERGIILFCREDKFAEDGKYQGISVMNSDGTNCRDLGPGATPDLSPDASQLVAIGGEMGREVVLIAVDGAWRRTIYRSQNYLSDPAFSWDGSSVLFIEWPGTNRPGKILIQDLKSRETTTIPEIAEP